MFLALALALVTQAPPEPPAVPTQAPAVAPAPDQPLIGNAPADPTATTTTIVQPQRLRSAPVGTFLAPPQDAPVPAGKQTPQAVYPSSQQAPQVYTAPAPVAAYSSQSYSYSGPGYGYSQSSYGYSAPYANAYQPPAARQGGVLFAPVRGVKKAFGGGHKCKKAARQAVACSPAGYSQASYTQVTYSTAPVYTAGACAACR